MKIILKVNELTFEMESLKKDQQEIKKKYYFQKKKDQSEKMNEINEVKLYF